MEKEGHWLHMAYGQHHLSLPGSTSHLGGNYCCCAPFSEGFGAGGSRRVTFVHIFANGPSNSSNDLIMCFILSKKNPKLIRLADGNDFDRCASLGG